MDITVDALISAVNRIEANLHIEDHYLDKQEMRDQANDMIETVVQRLRDEGDLYRAVRNAMDGRLVKERKDTPFACSVASETYWCS